MRVINFIMNDLSSLVTPQRLKIFLASFLMTFFLVSVQLVGIELPNFTNSISKEKSDVFEQRIIPLLKVGENNFFLRRPSQFIRDVHAANPWDEAHAYLVVDMDNGNIIAEKNANQKFPIASLTKIMTAIVALDLSSPDEFFTVSESAASQIPTKIGVVAGQQMTLEELLHAVMLTSANDAAEVIREGIDKKYKTKIFVRAMNKKAELLGLKNTHFTNPQGFDAPYHFSTAEDLARLTQYALTHYPFFAQIVKKEYMYLKKNKYHKQFDLYNWNGLVGVYPQVLGVKIGNTDAAKKTTIVVAKRQGKTVLVVLLGAPGIIERDLWAAELLNIGFKKTLGLESIQITDNMLREKYARWRYWN